MGVKSDVQISRSPDGYLVLPQKLKLGDENVLDFVSNQVGKGELSVTRTKSYLKLHQINASSFIHTALGVADKESLQKLIIGSLKTGQASRMITHNAKLRLRSTSRGSYAPAHRPRRLDWGYGCSRSPIK